MVVMHSPPQRAGSAAGSSLQDPDVSRDDQGASDLAIRVSQRQQEKALQQVQQGQNDLGASNSGQEGGPLRTEGANSSHDQHQHGASARPRQQQQQQQGVRQQGATAEGTSAGQQGGDRQQRQQQQQQQRQGQGIPPRSAQGQQMEPAGPGGQGISVGQLADSLHRLQAVAADLRNQVGAVEARQDRQQQELNAMHAALELLLQDKPQQQQQQQQQQGASGTRSGRKQTGSRQQRPQAAAAGASSEGEQPAEVYPPPPEGDPPPADSGQLQHRVQQLEAEVQRAVAKAQQAVDQQAALEATVRDTSATSASISAKIAAAGITSVETGAALKHAADKGAEAHMQQAALSDRVGAAEGEIRALKDQQQQQSSRLQAAENTRQGRIVVHAPAELQQEEVIKQVGKAAGISTSSILGAQLVGRNAVPAAPAPPAAPRGGSNGSPAAGNGSGSSSGAASDRQQRAAGGNGGSGGSTGAGSSSGADGSAGQRADGAADGSYAAAAAAAAGTAQGDAAGGGGRRKMVTYLLLVSTSALEPRLLGGYTRRNLRAANTHIYVEKPLTQEEMAQRQQLMPLRRRLRLKDCKTRWRGAVLEELVGRGSRRQWVNAATHGSESQQWQQQQRERAQSPQGRRGQQQQRQQQQRHHSPERPGGDAATVLSRQ